MGVKTLGYNRWPDTWPLIYPMWVRWPEIMEAASPWSYHLIMEQYELDPPGPPVLHLQPLAIHFDLFEGIMRWNVSPSLADQFTGTYLSRQIIVDEDGRYSIWSNLRFFGLNENLFEQDGHIMQYSPLGDGETAWTEKPFSIRYRKIGLPPIVECEVFIRIPKYCGEEWPPPES